MLDSIKIQNFGCLRLAAVGLRPLTVLIGANDSGKSTFLRAARLLAKGGASFKPADSFRHEFRNVKVGGQADGVTASVMWEPPSQPAGVWSVTCDPTFGPDWNPLGISSLLSISLNAATGVSMTSVGVPDGELPPTFGSDGSMVPSLADYLLRTSRKALFEQFEQKLRELIPGMESIDIRTPEPQLRRFDLIADRGVHIPGHDLSVGVRALIFYASLAYHPVEPAIITIEEPENGLHPKRLGDVMKLLRRLTQPSERRKGSQVILTTHSPYLLDHVDLDTDAVLVCQRQPDGERTIEAADKTRLERFLPEFMLGEVWFNEGEAGLLSARSS
ncbi:MAG: AAA family ATPase [Planctomycetota bacterium]